MPRENQARPTMYCTLLHYWLFTLENKIDLLSQLEGTQSTVQPKQIATQFHDLLLLLLNKWT